MPFVDFEQLHGRQEGLSRAADELADHVGRDANENFRRLFEDLRTRDEEAFRHLEQLGGSVGDRVSTDTRRDLVNETVSSFGRASDAYRQLSQGGPLGNMMREVDGKLRDLLNATQQLSQDYSDTMREYNERVGHLGDKLRDSRNVGEPFNPFGGIFGGGERERETRQLEEELGRQRDLFERTNQDSRGLEQLHQKLRAIEENAQRMNREGGPQEELQARGIVMTVANDAIQRYAESLFQSGRKATGRNVVDMIVRVSTEVNFDRNGSEELKQKISRIAEMAKRSNPDDGE